MRKVLRLVLGLSAVSISAEASVGGKELMQSLEERLQVDCETLSCRVLEKAQEIQRAIKSVNGLEDYTFMDKFNEGLGLLGRFSKRDVDGVEDPVDLWRSLRSVTDNGFYDHSNFSIATLPDESLINKCKNLLDGLFSCLWQAREVLSWQLATRGVSEAIVDIGNSLGGYEEISRNLSGEEFWSVCRLLVAWGCQNFPELEKGYHAFDFEGNEIVNENAWIEKMAGDFDELYKNLGSGAQQ